MPPPSIGERAAVPDAALLGPVWDAPKNIARYQNLLGVRDYFAAGDRLVTRQHKGMVMKRAATMALIIFASWILPHRAQASTASTALRQAVHAGARLFQEAHFGGHLQVPLNAQAAFASALSDQAPAQNTGITCATCHLHGGRTAGRLPDGRQIPSLRNAAAIFPRVAHGRVVTLGHQIRHCVRQGLGGTAPAYGSAALVDLTAYLGALAHGQRIAIGTPPH